MNGNQERLMWADALVSRRAPANSPPILRDCLTELAYEVDKVCRSNLWLYNPDNQPREHPQRRKDHLFFRQCDT